MSSMVSIVQVGIKYIILVIKSTIVIIVLNPTDIQVKNNRLSLFYFLFSFLFLYFLISNLELEISIYYTYWLHNHMIHRITWKVLE